MQLSDRIDKLLTVGNVIIFLLHIPFTYCQRVPSKDDFTIDQGQKFQMNGIIPDGHTVFAYFSKGQSKNYFFRVEKNNLPLNITLTPCSTAIRWILKKRQLLPDVEDIEGEEDDPDPDPFHAQRSVSQNPDTVYKIIGNFTGSRATTYFHRRVRRGLYMLEITAINSDTSVKLYGTTTPSVSHVTGFLPVDKKVKITSNSERMLSFKWNKATSAIQGFNESVEYCVLINRIRNFSSFCAAWSAKSSILGSSRSNGFGFSWEKKTEKRSKRKDKLFFKCIGSETKFTYEKAKLGKFYYVNVFVLNRQLNVDASYIGTRVKTGRNKTLTDGVRRTVKLHKGDVKKQVLFVTNTKIDSAVLELKSCRGKLPVTIYHEDNSIHKTVVRDRKILRMRNLPEGKYTIEFSGNRNRKRVVSVLLITSIYKKPRLPLNTRIRVREVTCNSIQISWFATNVKQRYCVYMRQTSTLPSKKSHHCLEMAGRRKKDKVFCVRKRWKGRNKPIRRTVEKLQPDTDYVFDVYVNRGKGASLAYKSVKARTKASCKK